MIMQLVGNGRMRRSVIAVSLTVCLGGSPLLAAPVHELTTSDAASGDDFGEAVAIDGNNILAGKGNFGVAGAAYLFDAVTGQERFELTPDDAFLGDSFGRSVALDGDIALVGQFSGNAFSVDAGSVYFFNVDTGQQLRKLTASDPAPLDGFGVSTGINGGHAIVGAFLDDGMGTDAGAAYVFDAATGQELYKLTASDAAPDRQFGRAVDISGNLAIIGSYDQSHRTTPGAAYVFDVATGQELRKLTASDGSPDDFFGISVGISGNLAIVGSRDGADAIGAAYVFDVTTGQELFKLKAQDPYFSDHFARNVAIDGKYAIAGALGDNDLGLSAGAAYVFDVTTGQLVLRLISSDTRGMDQFGRAVDINGNLAVVGAPFSDPGANPDINSGSVYVFQAPEPTSAALLSALVVPFARRTARMRRGTRSR